jgi:hypothetical protein
MAKADPMQAGTPQQMVGSVPKAPKGAGSAPPSNRDPQRPFSKKQKEKKLKQQAGRCAGCKKILSIAKTIGHHIKRWTDGGRTTTSNCACVCKPCHDKIHHRLGDVRRRRSLGRRYGEVMERDKKREP